MINEIEVPVVVENPKAVSNQFLTVYIPKDFYLRKKYIENILGLKADKAYVDSFYQFEKGVSKNSVGTLNNIVGLKGLYWKDIEFGTNSDKIYLSTACYYSDGTIKFDTEDFEFDINEIGWSKKSGFYPGDVISIHNDTEYLNCATILDLGKDGNGSYIIVTKLPFNNKVYDDLVEFAITDNAVFVQAKPNCGLVDFGMGAASFGEYNEVLNYMGFSGGYGNKVLGQYGTTFGTKNIAPYCGLTAGKNNANHGDHSIIGGENNTNDTNATCSILVGKGITNTAKRAIASGDNSNISIERGIVNGLNIGYTAVYGTDAYTPLKDQGDIVGMTGTNSIVVGSHISGIARSSVLVGEDIVAKNSNGNRAVCSSACGFKVKVGSYCFAGGIDVTNYAAEAIGVGKEITIGATAYGSAVFGRQNTCTHGRCLIAGGGHISAADYQTLLGKYSRISSNVLFAVGDGTSENDRANAFEVLIDGSAKLRDKTVATEEYVQSYIYETILGGEW